MMTAALITAVTTGALGSLHCAGMCGPLALAVGTGGERPVRRLLSFVSGKALTYAALGAVAGTVGAAFGAGKLGGNALAIVALVAGTLMVGIGAHTLVRKLVPRLSSRPSAVSQLLTRVLRARRPWAPLVAGSLAGLLPCGLVYAMTAQALAVGSTLGGAAVMVAFGVGTAPSMLATGWIGSKLSGRSRRMGEVLAASAVIVMGLVAVFRGVMILSGDPSTPPPCHSSGA